MKLKFDGKKLVIWTELIENLNTICFQTDEFLYIKVIIRQNLL